MKFRDKFNAIVKKNNSLLCIGLDPELEKLPKQFSSVNDLFSFNKAIIDTTYDLVSAYKPNIAFYEALGIDGLKQLKQTLEYLQQKYPDIPTILDAKRADIGNTARMYAKAAFEYWKADAVTVHPNLGKDALEPFFAYEDKLTILLIKTSNPDSGMFQNINVNGKPYYLHMAEMIKSWSFETLGLFVGATYPKELKDVRDLFPDRIFLSAGMGVQKADIERAVKAGLDKNGKGTMYNASRSIIYASNESDFAEKARLQAEETRNTINKYRE